MRKRVRSAPKTTTDRITSPLLLISDPRNMEDFLPVIYESRQKRVLPCPVQKQNVSKNKALKNSEAFCKVAKLGTWLFHSAPVIVGNNTVGVMAKFLRC